LVSSAWAAAVLLAAALARGETVGDALAPWSRGALDIHHINTGRGNATLFVLPDGTTMLVDAGDGGALPPRGTPPRPDASRPPAEWIARYVRAVGVEVPDVAVVDRRDAHRRAMAELARRVPVRVMVDRAWPDYAFPAADHGEFTTPEFGRYLELVRAGTVKPMRLVPGRADQIVLVRDPAAYPEFECATLQRTVRSGRAVRPP
jgi:hypothetical protein